MSTINQALSELADKEQQGASVKIEKAQINKVKTRPVLPWVIGGFSISLAIGGWAVSHQSETIDRSIDHSVVISEPTMVTVESNGALEPNSVPSIAEVTTQTSASQVTIYQAPVVEKSTTKIEQPLTLVAKNSTSDAPVAKASVAKASVSNTSVSKVSVSKAPIAPKPVASKPSPQKPILLASNTSSPSRVSSKAATKPEPVEQGGIIVEQVELTPVQLAEKAEIRARKAIDSNNIDEALSSYKDVLRYTPKDENSRQQLAALYYGKGDARRAFEILQDGIKIDNDSEALRIALAKLLIKEQQPEAALTPLLHLNHSPSVDYLSLRAALAQKNSLDDVALETYQQLVAADSANARWWLGLAIQHDRNSNMPEAKAAYQQALTKVGLSKQSQTFVRERLKLIDAIKESSSAN
ncbi:CDC27 family protein [Vibrio sp. YMD68]|uniref:CDC27 family protein n=1 Tax=Vibrio sp. YMD68 TaxID=3042300 RepID=UPI00249A9D7B|nr:CDC27 family protein [Vibrio sp. YMD68]WGV99967.1 CDC27 family protein [Vibrio sp. YMD68]